MTGGDEVGRSADGSRSGLEKYYHPDGPRRDISAGHDVRCREGIYNQCRHLVDDRCHNLVDDLCRQGVYNYRPGSPEGKNSSRYPRCLSIHAGGASRIQAPTTFHNGNRRLVSAVRNGNGNLTASRPSTALNNR